MTRIERDLTDTYSRANLEFLSKHAGMIMRCDPEFAKLHRDFQHHLLHDIQKLRKWCNNAEAD